MQTVNRRILIGLPIIGLGGLLASACVTGAPMLEQRTADPLATEFGQPRNQMFVGQGELILTREPDLYAALVRARPNQLRPGVPNVSGADNLKIVAYLDDQLLGDVQQLRGLRTSEVFSVRFYSKVETALKYGRSPVGGSIVVRTR